MRHAMRVLNSMMFFYFFLSCNSHKAVKSNEFKFLSDTTGYYKLEHEHHQRLTEALLLPKIDSGVDSVEFRIWSKAAMVNLNQVTVLSVKDSMWHLSETIYWSHPPDDIKNRRYILDSSKTKWFVPSLSYPAILDSLMKWRLDTIPTQTKTANFEDMTADGITYVIELSTNHYYKSLTYRNPRYY